MTSDRLQRDPLIRFHILVFALSIPFWLINPIADHLLDGTDVNLPASALMAVCPLIAAFILVGRENGSSGLKKLMATVLDPWRMKRMIDYVPIVLLMPLILLLTYAVMKIMKMPLPTPDIPWTSVPLLFVIFFIGAICEETGWMGYAADPMIKRWGVRNTGLVIGMIWAVWHVIPYMQANNSFYWIAGQCLFTVAQRVIIVVTYHRTGRSILGCVFIHMMGNVSWILFPNYGSHYDPMIAGAIIAIIAYWMARR